MKNNTFFSLAITLYFVMFFTLNVKAQDENVKQSSTTSTKVKSTDWQLLLSNEFVNVSYRYTDCKLPGEAVNNEYVYLQIKNKTDKELKTEWNLENWYNEKCHGCDLEDSENHKTVFLKSKETLEGSCSKESNRSLMVFSKMLNYEIKSNLTNFNLRGLKVTPVIK